MSRIRPIARLGYMDYSVVDNIFEMMRVRAARRHDQAGRDEHAMDLEQFRLDVADGIATVTFDRPPVNAQNRRTREELIRVFDTHQRPRRRARRDPHRRRQGVLRRRRHQGARRSGARAGRLRPPQPAGARVLLRGHGLHQAGDRGRQRAGDRRRLRADARLRHHARVRGRVFRHAGDQCRARWRRALPDGAFRPLARARDLFHRPPHAGGRALSARRDRSLPAARRS